MGKVRLIVKGEVKRVIEVPGRSGDVHCITDPSHLEEALDATEWAVKQSRSRR